MYEKYPDIAVEVSLERGDLAIPKIAAGELDMYFGALPAEVPFAGLSAFPMMRLEVNFFAHQRHAIHKVKPAVMAKRIMDYPWAAFSTHDTVSGMVDEGLNQRGFRPHKLSYGLDSISALAKLGQNTDCIIVAANAVKKSFAAYGLIPVNHAPTNVPFDTGIVCRSSFTHFEPVAEIIRVTRESCASNFDIRP